VQKKEGDEARLKARKEKGSGRIRLQEITKVRWIGAVKEN